MKGWSASSADSRFRWDWQPVTPQESQLVPVTSLKSDLAANDVKEAAAPQAQRVPPFENSPLTVFENVLHDADHVGRGELGHEHLPDGRPAMDRSLRHLVVHGIVGVESSQCIDIGPVEGLYPRVNELAWLHVLQRGNCAAPIGIRTNEGLGAFLDSMSVDLCSSRTVNGARGVEMYFSLVCRPLSRSLTTKERDLCLNCLELS